MRPRTGGDPRPDDPATFVERLRNEGRARYHDRHPFHLRMHEGRLRPEEIRSWVANRYYYLTRIPIKDALILAKSEDAAFRRRWRRRLVDHDGCAEGDGGLARWLTFAEAVGVPSDDLVSLRRVLSGVKAAAAADIDLVARASLVEAVASSLTECFAADLMRLRVDALERHYPWIDARGLGYFREHVPRAAREAEDALAFVVENAKTPADQGGCVAALVGKASILWTMLDCIDAAGGAGAP